MGEARREIRIQFWPDNLKSKKAFGALIRRRSDVMMDPMETRFETVDC